MKNTAAMPGVIAVGLGAPALFIGLFAFATGHAMIGVIAVVVAVLLFGSGLGWLARERRRVRRVEAQFVRDNPQADAQTPAS